MIRMIAAYIRGAFFRRRLPEEHPPKTTISLFNEAINELFCQLFFYSGLRISINAIPI
ncbi:MAG: hypothetical protein GX897_05545 [Clostridiales bacterium]|jgi:hypothetical protein|nr:hypothetical protein [Clostridiales bacterium]